MLRLIIPSINCKDFSCVKERLKIAGELFASLPSDLSAEAVAKAGALAKDGWVHVDVSDGKFTPHASWNNPEEFAKFQIPNSKFKTEVHLMVEDPESQIDAWLRAGAKRIIVHLEAMRDSIYIVEKCKKYGAECFLAINPGTEVERLLAHLDDFDGFLTLAVFPGPSGQEMKPEVLNKIKFLRAKATNALIEIDGGVNLETAKLAKTAGANLFVAGNYIFGNKNPQKAYQALEQAVL